MPGFKMCGNAQEHLSQARQFYTPAFRGREEGSSQGEHTFLRPCRNAAFQRSLAQRTISRQNAMFWTPQLEY